MMPNSGNTGIDRSEEVLLDAEWNAGAPLDKDVGVCLGMESRPSK